MAEDGHANDTFADAVNTENCIYLFIVKSPDFTTAKLETRRGEAQKSTFALLVSSRSAKEYRAAEVARDYEEVSAAKPSTRRRRLRATADDDD